MTLDDTTSRRYVLRIAAGGIAVTPFAGCTSPGEGGEGGGEGEGGEGGGEGGGGGEGEGGDYDVDDSGLGTQDHRGANFAAPTDG